LVVQGPPSPIPYIGVMSVIIIIFLIFLIVINKKTKPKLRTKVIIAIIPILLLLSIYYLYVVDLTQHLPYNGPTKDFKVTIENNSGRSINATLYINMTNGTSIYFTTFSLDSKQIHTTPVVTKIKGVYMICIRLDNDDYQERKVINSYGNSQPYIFIYDNYIKIAQAEY